jgi:hypothetical protein
MLVRGLGKDGGAGVDGDSGTGSGLDTSRDDSLVDCLDVEAEVVGVGDPGNRGAATAREGGSAGEGSA